MPLVPPTMGGDVDERHVGAALDARPQGDVVHAGHAGGAHAHGALVGHQHDPLVGVLGLEVEEHLLGGLVVLEQALAVELAVGAGVRVRPRGEQVGGDVAHGDHVGDDLDGLVDRGEVGEELGPRVAVQQVRCAPVPFLVGRLEAVGVGLVEEHLGLQDVGGAPGDVVVVAEEQVDEHFDGGTALHVGEQLEGVGHRDLGHIGLAEDDVPEERGLRAGGARGAGERVVGEEAQRLGAMLGAGVPDVPDELFDQGRVLDGLGVQTLLGTLLNLVEVVGVQAHGHPLGSRFVTRPPLYRRDRARHRPPMAARAQNRLSTSM